MTYEEVLRAFKDYQMIFMRGEPLYQEYDKAIEALEKQIPKYVNYVADGYADGELVYDTAYCPECDEMYEMDVGGWRSDYCSNCGQRLDWGECNE